MASVIVPISQYRYQATSKQAEIETRHKVIFVPTFIDLHSPVRKVSNALQWRRRLSGFFSNLISGAVSLR